MNLLVAVGLLLRCFNREQVYAFQTPKRVCRSPAGTMLSKTIDNKKELPREFRREKLRRNGCLVLRVLPEVFSSTPLDGLSSHAINVPSPLGAWVVLGALVGSSSVIFGSLVKLATPVVRDPDLLEKKTRSAEDLPPLDKWLSAVDTATKVSKKITTLNSRNNEANSLSNQASEASPSIEASEANLSNVANSSNRIDVIASRSEQPTLRRASNSAYSLDTGSVSVAAKDGSRFTSPQYAPQESKDDWKKDETNTEGLNLVASDKPAQGQLPKPNKKNLPLDTTAQKLPATNDTNLSADGIEQDEKLSNGLVNETVGEKQWPSMADANNTETQTKDNYANGASRPFVDENTSTQEDVLVLDLTENEYSAQAQVATEGTEALDKKGDLHSLEEGTSPVPTATSASDNTDLGSSADVDVDVVEQIKGQAPVPFISTSDDLKAIEAARQEELETEKIRHYVQKEAEKRTREVMRQRQITKQQTSIDQSPVVRTGSSGLLRQQTNTTSTVNSTTVRTGSSALFSSPQEATVASHQTSTSHSTAARTGSSVLLSNPQKGTVVSKVQLQENGHPKRFVSPKVDADDGETANMKQQAPIPSISKSSDLNGTAPETERQYEISTNKAQFKGGVALKKTQPMLQRRNIASYQASAAVPTGSSVLFSSREETAVASTGRLLENEDTTLGETTNPTLHLEQTTTPPNSKVLLHLSKQGDEPIGSTSSAVVAQQRTSTLFGARSKASREAADKKRHEALSVGHSKLIKMPQKTPGANPPSRVGRVFRISNIIWGIIAVILLRKVVL